MQCLNATVSPLLLDAIYPFPEREEVSSKKLAQAVADLSRLFTKERNSLSKLYLDDKLLGAAYLQYFLPVNLAKIQVLLNEMPRPEVRQHFSVLDIGSGPGTGALAVLDWWHQQALLDHLSVTAVDESTAALQQAKQLWDRYCQAAGVGAASLQIHAGDLERRAWLEQVGRKEPFDLIILANCLNEIYADENNPIKMRVSVVADALSLLAPHGTMMIVEPALRETSRALHQVRDRLLQEQRLPVIHSLFALRYSLAC